MAHQVPSRPKKPAMPAARRTVNKSRRSVAGVADRLPTEKPMLEPYRIGRETLPKAPPFLQLRKVISLKPGSWGGPTVENPGGSDPATSLLQSMGQNLKNRESFLRSNKDFHEIMAWASGSQIYGFPIDASIGMVDGPTPGVDYPDRRRTSILTAHTRSLDALLAHDGDSAQVSMAAPMNEYSIHLGEKYSDVPAETVTWDVP